MRTVFAMVCLLSACGAEDAAKVAATKAADTPTTTEQASESAPKPPTVCHNVFNPTSPTEVGWIACSDKEIADANEKLAPVIIKASTPAPKVEEPAAPAPTRDFKISFQYKTSSDILNPYSCDNGVVTTSKKAYMVFEATYTSLVPSPACTSDGAKALLCVVAQSAVQATAPCHFTTANGVPYDAYSAYSYFVAPDFSGYTTPEYVGL